MKKSFNNQGKKLIVSVTILFGMMGCTNTSPELRHRYSLEPGGLLIDKKTGAIWEVVKRETNTGESFVWRNIGTPPVHAPKKGDEFVVHFPDRE